MDAATGCITTPRKLLENSLAHCHAFLNWSGAEWSEAEARQHIFQESLPEEGDSWYRMKESRPFAVISRPNAANTITLAGTPRSYSSRGRLIVELHWEPDPIDKDDPGRNVRKIENFIGALLWGETDGTPGLLDLSGEYGYLNIINVQADGPYRVSSENVAVVGDCYVTYLDIDWGVSA